MDRDLALLYAASIVFPWCYCHICIWHVEKNVLVKAASQIADASCRELFMELWAKLIRSVSATAYNDQLASLKREFQDTPGLLEYLEDTWLGQWKEMVVCVWTDQHLHLGHYATSRVEGSHKVIKAHLQVSTGDLKTVFEKLTLMLDSKFNEYDSILDSNRS